MSCLVDVSVNLLFSEGRQQRLDMGKKGGGGERPGKGREGNCSGQDVIYKKGLFKKGERSKVKHL